MHAQPPQKNFSHIQGFICYWLRFVVLGSRTGGWPFLDRTPMDKFSISVELDDTVEKPETCFQFLQCTTSRLRWLTHFLIPCYLIILMVFCMVRDWSHCINNVSRAWQVWLQRKPPKQNPERHCHIVHPSLGYHCSSC